MTAYRLPSLTAPSLPLARTAAWHNGAAEDGPLFSQRRGASEWRQLADLPLREAAWSRGRGTRASSRNKWCLMSTVTMDHGLVTMDHGLGNRDMRKVFKMNRPMGNFNKKQQARTMEHVSVKPNERRKKLSLLQMQRGKVNKCRKIWQGSQKCKVVPFVLILFPSVLILFPFAHCHVCWCMQICNVYTDSTIIFYFLFYRDSFIT